MRLFFANCTQQTQHLTFRVIETKQVYNQSCDAGQGIMLGGGDLSMPQIKAIIEQYARYGLRVTDELKAVPDDTLVPMLVSLDGPIEATTIHRVMQHNQRVQFLMGKKSREEAAIAASKGIGEYTPEAADTLSVTMQEDKPGTGGDGGDPLNVGLRISPARGVTSPPDPSLAGFTAFIRDVMGVPVAALADGAYVIGLSYNTSLLTVNPQLNVVQVPNITYTEGGVPRYPSIYTLAVYNLGGDFLVNFAADNPLAQEPWDKYWSELRKTLGLNSFVAGLVQSSSDQGTSQSFMTLDWMHSMGLSDLQRMKTPWGRAYIAIAQQYGSAVWGTHGMTTLHFGVPATRYRHGTRSMTVLDVARILESRYGIMRYFYDTHTDEVAIAVIDSFARATENALKGSPATDPSPAMGSKIEHLFKAYITAQEMDGNVKGVPTMASLMGVSHRFKHPYARRPPRPSFVDTGLYRASFKAWLEW